MNKVAYDKIIILSDVHSNDETRLRTVVLCMNGFKLEHGIYMNNALDTDEGETYEDIVEVLTKEIQDDWKDEDFELETDEVASIPDVLDCVAEYIDDHWSEETMVMYYNPDEKIFDMLKSKLKHEYNDDIQLSNYMGLFVVDKDTLNKKNDIFVMMKNVGINLTMVNKDSYLSLGYSLGLLFDLIYSP